MYNVFGGEKKVKVLLFLLIDSIWLSLLWSRYTKSGILPFQIYITVTWWTNNPSDLLVLLSYTYYIIGFIRLKEGEWLSRLKEGVKVGGGLCVPFWYAALCILWHWVIFGEGELSLLQMCEEEAERHAWRGICSWRVLCHWRSLHRLCSAPSLFVLCPLPMQHFAMG